MAKVNELPVRHSRLFKRVEDTFYSLSDNDKKLAEHLLARFPRGAWETVEGVARDVGVSKAAVIRFASRLGYEGFGDLQRELQEELEEIFISPLALLNTVQSTAGSEAYDQFREGILQNIAAAPDHETLDALNTVPQKLLKCKGRIYILGASRSFGAAHYFHSALSLLMENVVLLPNEPSALGTAMLDISPKDIVIGISVRRYSTLVVKALRRCHERGAHVVGITDSLLSPVRGISTDLMVAPTKASSFFDSSVMIILYIEAIIGAASALSRDHASKRLSALSEIDIEFATFENVRHDKIR